MLWGFGSPDSRASFQGSQNEPLFADRILGRSNVMSFKIEVFLQIDSRELPPDLRCESPGLLGFGTYPLKSARYSARRSVAILLKKTG